jgi:hypothetical protein
LGHILPAYERVIQELMVGGSKVFFDDLLTIDPTIGEKYFLNQLIIYKLSLLVEN